MYKEMVAFEKAVRKIEEKIAKLKNERDELVRQKAQLGREYNDMVIAEAVGDEPADTKQLAKLKKKIEEIEKEIKTIDERLEAIEERRAEKLSEYLPAMFRGYQREMKKAHDEILAKNADIFKMRCEYLLTLYEIHQRREEARRIHDKFIGLAREVTDEYEGMRFTLPGTNLFNDYYDTPIGITERESKQALNGYLPPNVMLYKVSGDVVFSNSAAATKLREIKAQEAEK